MRTKKTIDRSLETAKKYVECSKRFYYCDGNCDECQYSARMGDVARAVGILIEEYERIRVIE